MYRQEELCSALPPRKSFPPLLLLTGFVPHETTTHRHTQEHTTLLSMCGGRADGVGHGGMLDTVVTMCELIIYDDVGMSLILVKHDVYIEFAHAHRYTPQRRQSTTYSRQFRTVYHCCSGYQQIGSSCRRKPSTMHLYTYLKVIESCITYIIWFV